jgi:signal transduction histidine kinase
MVGATISIDAYKKAEALLRDIDRRKDEFLAMLAHELRNPLAPISTAAHLLQLQTGDEKLVRKASEVIARQVSHITSLVDDLLDVSRVTRGVIHLEKSVVELPSVVADAVEQARPTIDARGHVLEIRAEAGHAPVLGDRTRLTQAIANVLVNAAKYTPPNGQITLRLEVIGSTARIAVRDNGLGIDACLLPHVFELFRQGDRSLDRSQGGLGIGLSLAERRYTR